MVGLWSVALRAALGAFKDLGIDVAELCRRCEIDADLLEDADARIPLELSGRIWPIGALMWGRAGIGLHAGRGLKFGSLEALDYAFATAPTVAQGLAKLSQYFDVVTNGVTRMTVTSDGAEVRVEWVPLPIDDLRDYGVACFVERLAFARVDPLRVELHGRPVAPRHEYANLLGCKVDFDRPASVVVLRDADAQRALPSSLPGLSAVIARELTRAQDGAARDQDPLLDVRREVRASLAHGAPALRDVARRLAVGERTLQRRLAAQHATFKDIVDETRRAIATSHLKSNRLSLGEIAFVLGYSEPSAFSRAFRRWTGEWPAEFRARERGVRASAQAPERTSATNTALRTNTSQKNKTPR